MKKSKHFSSRILFLSILISVFAALVFVSLQNRDQISQIVAQTVAEKFLPKVEIENKLKECMEISEAGIAEEGNLLLLKTNWKNMRNTGEYGCRSATINYVSALVKTNEAENRILWVTIDSRDKAEYEFILNPDIALAYDGFSYKLTISCALNP